MISAEQAHEEWIHTRGVQIELHEMIQTLRSLRAQLERYVYARCGDGTGWDAPCLDRAIDALERQAIGEWK